MPFQADRCAACPPPGRCGCYFGGDLFTDHTTVGPLLIDVPLALRFAITTPILGALMTWLVMPRLSRLVADGHPNFKSSSDAPHIRTPSAETRCDLVATLGSVEFPG